MERFGKLAAQALTQILGQPVRLLELETPPDPKLGDFGFPCFKLAKSFKKSPPQIAAQIASQIQTQNALPADLTVAAVGPYVNFTVPPQKALSSLLKDFLAGSGLGAYGKLPEKSRGNWVLEFSSPNVAKPLNIYHLRPTALGATLDRIGRFRGFEVTTINHLGDWGKQYGMLAVAFRIFGKTLESNLTMPELVDLYVKVNAEAKKNPALEEEAKANFVKLEQGDPSVTALWKKCVDISLKEFNRVYARLGIRFDHIWGESFYKDQTSSVLKDLKRLNLLVESEGALIVPITDESGRELTPVIMQKSDGATIYATRDVAAAIYRCERFHFDRMTYIVGSEQKLHFQQIFSVLRKMGFAWASKCEHVPTGLYRFKDAKMSTRDGNYVTLEEVIELAKNRVRTLMAERDKETTSTAEELERIQEAIAVGAVVFHDLQTDPARDVDFDVERVVDFEGETGPYLQYAHTRCLSILRKARETGQLSGDVAFHEGQVARLVKEEELALVKILGMFPFHLERVLTFSKASQLANYLIDVTRVFGAFYRECKVLGEAPEMTSARLMLVEVTRRILGRGLGLLGIPLPERM